MTAVVPESKPRLSYSELLPLIRSAGLAVEQHPLFVVGIRGYYAQSMGATPKNDRGIYDDALFLVSPNFFGAYNANTDPSVRRPGRGMADSSKGMACLRPGVWLSYRFGMHKTYEAIIQTGGQVTVTRDGLDGDYPDTGYFGVNIHRGGYNTTSSLGCQTIYPKQWDAFIASAHDQARRHHGAAWRRTTIPYVLIDGSRA